MRRREFILLIGIIAAAWPRGLTAQSVAQPGTKVPRIGLLATIPSQPRLEAFDRALREHGFVEGETIFVERRFWNNDPEQLAKFVAELVSLDVDVIVAPSTPEAVAARAVTSTIPIVTATADPIGVGLAASLARPGGNVTGLTAVGNSKNFGLLVELLPGASRFAVLLDPDNQYHARLMVGFQRTAAERRIELLPVVKRSVEDIGPAFQTMASKGVEGLLVLVDPIGFANRRKIIELAAQNRIPAVYHFREEAVEGGLLAYGPDVVDLNRRSAAYVAKLLRGAKAAELPIEQAERYRLVINLKTAKALGLTIPTALLATADEVIE